MIKILRHKDLFNTETDVILADELHRIIQSKNQSLNIWILRIIKRFNLKLDIDYFFTKMESTGGRPATKYYFTLETSLIVCQNERNDSIERIELLKFLKSKLNINDVIVSNNTKRLEYNFHEILAELFPFKFKTQVYFGKYRVDFIYDNLIIEYDEVYHNAEKQYINDCIRENELLDLIVTERKFVIQDFEKDWLTIIRVKQNQEISGIKEIYEYFIANDYIFQFDKETKYNLKSYIEMEKQDFINEVINNQVDLNYFNMTSNELIKKIKSIN